MSEPNLKLDFFSAISLLNILKLMLTFFTTYVVIYYSSNYLFNTRISEKEILRLFNLTSFIIAIISPFNPWLLKFDKKHLEFNKNVDMPSYDQKPYELPYELKYNPHYSREYASFGGDGVIYLLILPFLLISSILMKITFLVIKYEKAILKKNTSFNVNEIEKNIYYWTMKIKYGSKLTLGVGLISLLFGMIFSFFYY